MKSFASAANAKAAIVKAGLQNVPYEIQQRRGLNRTTRYVPVFTVDLQADRDYIVGEKDFEAVLQPVAREDVL